MTAFIRIILLTSFLWQGCSNAGSIDTDSVDTDTPAGDEETGSEDTVETDSDTATTTSNPPPSMTDTASECESMDSADISDACNRYAECLFGAADETPTYQQITDATCDQWYEKGGTVCDTASSTCRFYPLDMHQIHCEVQPSSTVACTDTMMPGDTECIPKIDNPEDACIPGKSCCGFYPSWESPYDRAYRIDTDTDACRGTLDSQWELLHIRCENLGSPSASCICLHRPDGA